MGLQTQVTCDKETARLSNGDTEEAGGRSSRGWGSGDRLRWVSKSQTRERSVRYGKSPEDRQALKPTLTSSLIRGVGASNREILLFFLKTGRRKVKAHDFLQWQSWREWSVGSPDYNTCLHSG